MAGSMKGWVLRERCEGAHSCPLYLSDLRSLKGRITRAKGESGWGLGPGPLSFSVRYWSQVLRGQWASPGFLHLLGHPLFPGQHPPAALWGP